MPEFTPCPNYAATALAAVLRQRGSTLQVRQLGEAGWRHRDNGGGQGIFRFAQEVTPGPPPEDCADGAHRRPGGGVPPGSRLVLKGQRECVRAVLGKTRAGGIRTALLLPAAGRVELPEDAQVRPASSGPLADPC